MHLQPSTLLQGRYRIHRLIAQGGMGAVYQATDERLGNTVALKQTLVSDPQLRAAFEREARLLAGLHHPALPVVSDHFAEGSGQFLVMQFIPGDDLASLLKQRGGAFPPAEVLPWAERLLDALDYLHARTPPIIHRDIKPQNLKLTARGELMLLDFGLAKGAAATSSATQGLSVFGYTPQYAPLEQIQGAGTDPRSDLYAVGATLYELLTGQPPADALTRAAATVSGSPDPLQLAHTLNPQIPVGVSQTLQHALALAPLQRPAGAAELRAALRAAASPQPRPPILPTGPAASSAGQATVMVAPASSAGQPTILAQQGAAAQPTLLAPAPRSPTGAPGLIRWALAVLLGVILVVSLVFLRIGFRNIDGVIAVPPGSGGIIGENPVGGGIIGENPVGGGTNVDPATVPGLTRQNPLPPDGEARSASWAVRVLEVQRGEEARRTLQTRPPEGSEFVLVRVRATRTASGEPASFQVGDMGLVGERQIVYSGFATVAPEPRLIDADEVGRGGTNEGWAVYRIDSSEQNLLLMVDELLSGNTPPQYIALSPGATLATDPALAAIAPTTLGADRLEPATVGETVITEDWEVTVRQVYRGEPAWERIFAGNTFNKEALPGFEFALAEVTVRYIGERDEADLIFDSYFTGVDAAGNEVKQPSVVEPDPSLQAKLFPGGSATGWVAVAVPQGDANARLVFKATPIGLDADSSEVRYFSTGL